MPIFARYLSKSIFFQYYIITFRFWEQIFYEHEQIIIFSEQKIKHNEQIIIYDEQKVTHREHLIIKEK